MQCFVLLFLLLLVCLPVRAQGWLETGPDSIGKYFVLYATQTNQGSNQIAAFTIKNGPIGGASNTEEWSIRGKYHDGDSVMGVTDILTIPINVSNAKRMAVQLVNSTTTDAHLNVGGAIHSTSFSLFVLGKTGDSPNYNGSYAPLKPESTNSRETLTSYALGKKEGVSTTELVPIYTDASAQVRLATYGIYHYDVDDLTFVKLHVPTSASTSFAGELENVIITVKRE